MNVNTLPFLVLLFSERLNNYMTYVKRYFIYINGSEHRIFKESYVLIKLVEKHIFFQY